MIVAVIGRRSCKAVFAEYVKRCHEAELRQLMELIEAYEQQRLECETGKEPPEELQEDDEDWASLDCPCNRQEHRGHLIPWYTAGFT